MPVGQGLALMCLDPATLNAAGIVPLPSLLELLASLVGQDPSRCGNLSPRPMVL